MSVTAVPIQPVQQGALAKIWVGVLAVVAFGALLAWLGSDLGISTTGSGLRYKVIEAGEGPSPTATDTALVKYSGRLEDGTVFDQNDQAPLPVGGMIPGFSEGLQLMQKGGKYTLWIPGELAYGENPPSPEIPANATLIFDVELLDFISQEQMQALQQQFQQQQGAQGAPGQAVPGASPPPGAAPPSGQ